MNRPVSLIVVVAVILTLYVSDIPDTFAPSHPIGFTAPPECTQTLYTVEGFGEVCGDPALASICRTFGMDSHVLCPRITEENPPPVQTLAPPRPVETGLTMNSLMIIIAIGIIFIIGIIIFRRRKR